MCVCARAHTRVVSEPHDAVGKGWVKNEFCPRDLRPWQCTPENWYMEPKLTLDAGWGNTQDDVSSPIWILKILFSYYYFIFKKYFWRLKCRPCYKARLEGVAWLWSHMRLLILFYFELTLQNTTPTGTEAVLPGLPHGWRNRPEHTCRPQTRLPATGPSSSEFRKPGLLWGEGMEKGWTKAWTSALDSLLLCIACHLSHFPVRVWIIERSQYLNISPQSWFGFCFFTIWRMHLLNQLRNVGCKAWTVLCLVSSYFATFNTNLSVMAGILIGRILIMQESQCEILSPRLWSK